MQRISQIAAIDLHRGLGKGGDLLYKIPEDLKRFRSLTSGHPVIMGRKTWESLPEQVRPMPGRVNIVVTRQSEYDASGASLASSIQEAIDMAKLAPGSDEIFVIGGGEIYKEALPYTDRLYLTIVEDSKDADAFFPTHDEFTKVVEDVAQEHQGLPYRYLTLDRE